MKRRNKFITALALIAALQVAPATSILAAKTYASETAVTAAVSNIDSMFISEDNYLTSMQNIVEPYINSRLSTGYFAGKNNANIYYETYKADNAKGNIVISHGFTENLERYHELIYYFLQQGYDVYALEHRGHGRSGSLGVKDETQQHVEKFNYYVLDFKTFMDTVVNPSNTKKLPVFLYAHSMGGGIGVRFMEQFKGYFNAAILSAPMLEIHTGNVPASIAKAIAKGAVEIGLGGNYVAGQGPYSGPEYNPSEIGTSSINRYEYANNISAANPIFHRGGASYNWLNESFEAVEKAISKPMASKVNIPVLLFQAGKDDYVKSGGQNTFAKYAKNCTINRYNESRHEIYRENDSILRTYLNEVFDFYSNNL